MWSSVFRLDLGSESRRRRLGREHLMFWLLVGSIRLSIFFVWITFSNYADLSKYSLYATTSSIKPGDEKNLSNIYFTVISLKYTCVVLCWIFSPSSSSETDRSSTSFGGR